MLSSTISNSLVQDELSFQDQVTITPPTFPDQYTIDTPSESLKIDACGKQLTADT